MAYWKIEFNEQAKKQFLKLDKQSQKQLQTYFNTKILKLGNPKLSGKALSSNKKGLWRYRVNKFRIICRIEKELLVVLVAKIAKRDVVYDD